MNTPLDYLDEIGLRPLPEQALTVLSRFDIPPLLWAHLALVHDAAAQLVEAVTRVWPTVPLDGRAVVLGAAWHDIGKVVHPDELHSPGSAHENAGVRLLVEAGVAPELARFAQTHAANAGPEITLEDLLVALADSCWKGQRSATLEARITASISGSVGSPEWEVFMALDDEIERISALGERRLAWQAQFANPKLTNP